MGRLLRPDADLAGLAVHRRHGLPLGDVVHRQQDGQAQHGRRVRLGGHRLGFQGLLDHGGIVVGDLVGHPALKLPGVDVPHLDPLAGGVGEVEFLQVVQLEGLHAVQEEVVKLVGAVDEDVVHVPAAVEGPAAVHPAHRAVDRPPDQLVGQVEARQPVRQGGQVFGLRLPGVPAAPVLQAARGLLPGDPEGEDELRQIRRGEVLGPDQGPPAEGAACHGLPLLEDQGGAAARAVGLEQAVLPGALLDLLLLEAAEALFLGQGLLGPHRSAAVAAEVFLLDDVVSCRSTAARAAYIRNGAFHVRAPFSAVGWL